jgi:pimeloyl-ACP methyl ester carboxylesterase
MDRVERAVRYVTRPLRVEYNDSSMPPEFEFEGGVAVRIPFVVKSPNGSEMPASLYQVPDQLPGNPVLVFGHGNAMNQYDSLNYGAWDELLALGVSCCFFDFAGCGLGTDEFMTLGVREKGEFAAVLDHLRLAFGCERFIVWGLSMGGLPAMSLIPERADIVAAVIDEPVKSVARVLRKFIREGGADEEVYAAARAKIQELTGTDVEELDLRTVAPSVKVPFALIRSYTERPPVTEHLLELVGSEKKRFLTFRGWHNGFRSTEVFAGAFQLIADALGITTHGESE